MSLRLQRLRDLAAERQLDGILVTHPSNRFYLSGYSGEDDPPNESAGVLLIGATTALLFTGATNVAWAEAEAPTFTTKPWTRPWAGFLVQVLRDLGWKRMGFEDDAVLYATHRDLCAGLDGQTELVPLGDAVDKLRSVKEPVELEALAKAISITDAAFVAATADLEFGMTERDLARRIERELRERGAEREAFHTIVAAGPHAARPHHAPTDRPIERGEPVIIDMGAHVDGYNGDLTRTTWIGHPTEELRRVYASVEAAQRGALGVIRDGVAAKDVDAAARSILTAAGLGEAFSHGVGHGLGVRVHEAPSVSQMSEDILHAGQVLTVEPGAYLPGWGGVRIEDVVVVEPGGYRMLTGAPKKQSETRDTGGTTA
ncbi:MAG: Xaa-Pro peptidase family protein [Chloroflexota bacterium]|nr:Xaa-Pro peptidase family protein [Chloroflexota bacterium]